MATNLNDLSNNKQPIGVIGAGSFGTTIANIAAENGPVLLLARRKEVAQKMRETLFHKGQQIHENIEIISSSEELARRCQLIFPVVPSASFGPMIRDMASFLKPEHVLIHATKGLYVEGVIGEDYYTLDRLDKKDVYTMSELIQKETLVKRIGCVAGPNLASEIAEGQPAATVVASPFEQVISEGSVALRSSRFRVHASKDLLGIELAGSLKNIMAIGAGILTGLGYGNNTLALLVTRGLAEMVHLGKVLGIGPQAFLGLAGIGDLVATCASPHSRNHTVGRRLAQGESLTEIVADMEEVAEGIKTVCICRALANQYKVPAVITQALHRVLFKEMDVKHAMELLMEHPFHADVEWV